LGKSEILLLACQPSPEFVNHSMAEGLLATREVLLDMFRNAAPTAPNALADKMAKLKPLPSQLYGLHLLVTCGAALGVTSTWTVRTS
jgi:hypothetical protein